MWNVLGHRQLNVRTYGISLAWALEFKRFHPINSFFLSFFPLNCLLFHGMHAARQWRQFAYIAHFYFQTDFSIILHRFIIRKPSMSLSSKVHHNLALLCKPFTMIQRVCVRFFFPTGTFILLYQRKKREQINKFIYWTFDSAA